MNSKPSQQRAPEPKKRLDQAGRWEYQCHKCQDWLPPKRFKKKGRRKDRLSSICTSCVNRILTYNAQQAAKPTVKQVMRRRMMNDAALKAKETAAIGEIYLKAKELTEQTGVRHSVDHEVPIKHDLVCGLHVAANLKIETLADNARKGNRFTPYYQLPDGRRSEIVEDPSYIYMAAAKPEPSKQVRVIKVLKAG